MKQFFLPILFFGGVSLSAAGATESGDVHNWQGPVPPVPSLEGAAQPKSKHRDKKEVDFVLAEVRKLLEPNPETEVAELSIDPDYVGAGETYLVNVVLDTHEQKLLLGVLVTLHPVADGWETTIGFVD